MTLPNILSGVDVGDDGTYCDVSHDVVTYISGEGLGCGRWKLIATIHRPCHETIYLVKL